MRSTTTHHEDLAAGRWQVDQVHSTANFAVRHNGISMFRGRFEEFDAHLEASQDGTLSLAGVVQSESISVRDDKLAAHLRAPDFFHTERFKEVRFTSQDVRRHGGALEVDGELQIKDHVRSVTGSGSISAVTQDPFGGTKVAVEVETTIDRIDFGLDFDMPMPGGGLYLAREVKISLVLEFAKDS